MATAQQADSYGFSQEGGSKLNPSAAADREDDEQDAKLQSREAIDHGLGNGSV